MSEKHDPFEGIDGEIQPAKKSTKKKKSKKPVEDVIIEQLVEDMKEDAIEPPLPPPRQHVAPDNTKDRASVIFAIKAYHKSPRFAKFLKSQGKVCTEARLTKMTLDQLKLELESLDMTVAGKGNGDFIQGLIKNGLLMTESIVHDRTKFKVKGTSNELFENERFLDLLERVKLKYGLPSVQLDPALELSLVVMQTAMAVHSQHTFMDGLTDTNLNLDEEITHKEKKISTKKHEDMQ